MRKRIAMVEPHGSGGICHYTYQLCQALESEGIEVTLFTNDKYELRNFPRSFRVESFASSELKKWITVRLGKTDDQRSKATPKNKPKEEPKRTHQEIKSTPTKSSQWRSFIVSGLMYLRDIYIQSELLVRIRLKKIRILHIQFLWPLRHSGFFLLLARILGIKIIHTAHNILPHDYTDKNAIEKKRVWYGAVDKIVVHSKSNFIELLDLFDVSRDKVFTIAHGNYSFFLNISGESTDQTKEQFKIQPNKKVVLFFGSIRKYKGLEYLIHAFYNAHLQNKDLFLVIAGKPWTNGGEDEKYYRDLIESLGIGHSVKFDADYIAIESVANYFRATDAVVLPYLKTYESGVAHLAFAFGKPVIATRTGGLPDMIVNGENGYLVEPKNKEELCDAILRMFSSDELRREMGGKARQISETVYSWERVARATKEMYFKKN